MGSSGDAGVVTLLVVVDVEVDSFSLLQPANNVNVTKPIVIISLVFISSILVFVLCEFDSSSFSNLSMGLALNLDTARVFLSS